MFYLGKWISGMSTIPIHSNRRWSLNNIGLNCLDFGIPWTLLRYQYESIARLFGHRSALTSHKIPNYAASSGRSEQILTPCFIYDFRMGNACIVLLHRLNAFVCCIFAKTWNAMASLGILLPIDLAPAMFATIWKVVVQYFWLLLPIEYLPIQMNESYGYIWNSNSIFFFTLNIWIQLVVMHIHIHIHEHKI